MKFSVQRFVILVCVLSVLFSVIGLLPRLEAEKRNTDLAVIADFRDILPLAQEADLSVDQALSFLKQKGLTGLMVGEFTGEDILNGIGPLRISPFLNSADTLGTLLQIPKDFPHTANLTDILSLRTGSQPFKLPQGLGIVYPAPMDTLRKSGIMPDLEGLEAARRSNFPVFYRIAGAQTWQLHKSLNTAKKILAWYPEISLVAPSGEIALGYPDMKPLAALLKEKKIPVAIIEFSRQLGANQLNGLMYPSLISLHSVTNEELLARNIDRIALHERFVRAAAERSVRLLVLRPPFSGNVTSPLEYFGSEIERLVDVLKTYGLKNGWPKPMFQQGNLRSTGITILSALACSMMFLLSFSRYLKRLTGMQDEPIEFGEGAFFFFLASVIAIALWKADSAARLVGALTAVFVVIEASLLAMENPQRLWRNLFMGFTFAVIGGMAIAAFFSIPVYMLRLKAFSGVKLTLLLPPFLVLLHDFRRRIHPESLTTFLSRPPIWGELVLGIFLIALLGIILFRSDNVQFIPGIEAQIRNALERLLVARPRNKEIFIGYPSLLLYAYAVKNGLWVRYRELLRLGVVFGISSVVNSFCHFHTPFFFIMLREFHGLWVGILLGLFTVAVFKFCILPLWQKFRFVTQ